MFLVANAKQSIAIYNAAGNKLHEFRVSHLSWDFSKCSSYTLKREKSCRLNYSTFQMCITFVHFSLHVFLHMAAWLYSPMFAVCNLVAGGRTAVQVWLVCFREADLCPRWWRGDDLWYLWPIRKQIWYGSGRLWNLLLPHSTKNVLSQPSRNNYNFMLTLIQQEAMDLKIADCKIFPSFHDSGIIIMTTAYRFWIKSDVTSKTAARKLADIPG